MRRSIILLTALLAAAACRQAEDTRYFAPAVQFGSDRYAVNAGDGSLDIDLHLSRPASQALHIGLNVSSSLEEGVQYRVASRTVDIAPGQQDATVHVDLLDDEIWVESAWIDLLLKPGERYTLDPEKNCSTRVDVSKAISIPIFRLVAPEAPVVTNPYLAETLRFQLEADRATSADLEVVLGFGDLELGKDYRIAGSETAGFIYPAGARSRTFEVEILKKDLSGYDREALLSVLPQKGSYSVDPDKAAEALPVPLHSLVPHGGRAHPQSPLPVERAVHHHGLQGLGMGGEAQHLVFFSLEMPVFPGLDLLRHGALYSFLRPLYDSGRSLSVYPRALFLSTETGRKGGSGV